MTIKILFVGTHEDKSYLQHLKYCVGAATVFIRLEPVTTITEVVMHAKRVGATAVISTSLPLLKKLTYLENENPSIDNYAGSLFHHPDSGLDIVFIDPLRQLVTVPYGRYVTTRYITKLLNPESWIDVELGLSGSFNFTIVEPSNAQHFLELLETAELAACDIETIKEPLAITCMGFTTLHELAVRPIVTSFVLPIDSEFSLVWLKKFCASAAPKIFQNGKYDLSYLSSWGAPVHNYLWDTATLFHCWHVEFPKDLGFLQSFFVRNAQYWKDLAKTKDTLEYYRYNALDTWGTLLAFLGMMAKLPEYVKTNYLQEFPLLFPCHLAEMTGILQDASRREAQYESFSRKVEAATTSLQKAVATPGFNVNSHVQVKALMHILGCKDLASSSDENALKKAAYRHPLNARIFEAILDIRGQRKLVSTYLTDKTYKGRVLYSLNPHGTDTGRLASREHHFWCGLQIQNIPRGEDVKCTIIADPDFELYECDLEQAESRDTAYAAGDTALITAVSGDRDFHSINAAAFFGRKYEDIYDQERRKPKDKPLRDLAKRVNHGANYLMGEDVLVDTMGLVNIYAAAAALKLPRGKTPKQIAAYLLDQFHRTYPHLSAVFYPAVTAEVMKTKRLTSKAQHVIEYQATTAGWVRECFKDPMKNKRAKNAYVAHIAQSLNAMTLNKAFMKVFYEIALKYPTNFKLHAQIHDSILFSVRKGHEHLAAKVKEFMQVPVRITSYDGVVREFTVPAELKGPAQTWSKL